MEELLRESACLGNLDGVQKLLQSGTSVNSQNSVNGCPCRHSRPTRVRKILTVENAGDLDRHFYRLMKTALHWASKRGHSSIVHLLLQSGADPEIKTHNGQLPVDVATTADVLKLLTGDTEVLERVSKNTSSTPDLPFTPNYLVNPAFPYYDVHSRGSPLPTHTTPRPATSGSSLTATELSTELESLTLSEDEHHGKEAKFVNGEPPDNSGSAGSTGLQVVAASPPTHPSPSPSSVPLVVKVRVSRHNEVDFVEADVSPLTYDALLSACCREVEVDASDVARIRKLPNVWVRKDRDVQRMKEGQELEVVIKESSVIKYV